ncbi:cytochrome C biogenesis protein CcdA [Aestuarium zhoushanense]|uniref:cytochrome c-type biogenesis protein n=1 Tax=Marivivens donghaensis TaxID=1699413 RepID=UPI000CA39C71|nr:cytochrome c-type biogenesis protein [Marivivens donghaensis]AUJ63856.1 cytochrome C biogenesis protein CcdA [Aestuarium zhoushanense]MCL7408014.1 cytochrome c-type biogenesis protein CcmH [Marivivens donghaensis]MDN3704007.1 cytochrome c-type biogenesis protein CcmH [Marivivens donghaensis]
MKRLLLAALLTLSTPVMAVQPDEVLDDQVLETRARDISKGLRCPVCQNENIDDSNSAISRELRLLVRDRLIEGDTNEEVVDFIVARYGEYVLLEPTKDGFNMILWVAPLGMLILALGAGFATVRRKGTASSDALTDAEKARLEEIMKS